MTVCLFRATEAELRAAFPTFKVPLSVPVLRRQRNPLTGELVETPSWDPNPDERVGASNGEGTARLAHFDASTMDLRDFLHLVSLILSTPYDEETLFGGRPALVGPSDETPGPFEIPRAFVSTLASVDDASVAELADRWMAASIVDFAAYRQQWEGGAVWEETVKQWRETLVALVAFVRTAASKQQGIYVELSD